jgi:anaerobic dimethyl sulfoxide reductase subunit A
MVHVFNDRGRIAIPAWVTERIMPGVVSVFEGAWYAPDEQGVDRGGCANTLTRDAYSGGGAAVLNTSLVQVEKEKS